MKVTCHCETEFELHGQEDECSGCGQPWSRCAKCGQPTDYGIQCEECRKTLRQMDDQPTLRMDGKS
jgi:predicted amidophosphoribosyltransferase